MTKKAETADLFQFETVTLDDIIIDESKNIRQIYPASDEKMAEFIATVGTNGFFGTVEVGEKTAKGYPLWMGFQRVGAAQYIRDFLKLVNEMHAIREREEKEGVDLLEERQKVEEKYGDLMKMWLAWRDAGATREKLAEQKGEPSQDAKGNKAEYTLKEIKDLLEKWAEKTARIPVQVVDIKDPVERKMRQLSENIDRQALKPGEEAQAVLDLVEFYQTKKKMDKTESMRAVGQRLGGRSLSWVQQSLLLAKAAPEVQEAMSQGEVGRAQTLEIVRAKNKTEQLTLLDRARKGATVRDIKKSRKPAKGSKPARGDKQTNLVKGAELTTKVGKHEVVIAEENPGEGDFIVQVNGETLLSYKITKSGSLKASGSASEVLNVKTDLGLMVVQHDPAVQERFSIDVDGVEVAELMLDGKGDVEFKSIPKGEREKGAKTKGKKKSAGRREKAKAAAE